MVVERIEPDGLGSGFGAQGCVSGQELSVFRSDGFDFGLHGPLLACQFRQFGVGTPGLILGLGAGLPKLFPFDSVEFPGRKGGRALAHPGAVGAFAVEVEDLETRGELVQQGRSGQEAPGVCVVQAAASEEAQG